MESSLTFNCWKCRKDGHDKRDFFDSKANNDKEKAKNPSQNKKPQQKSKRKTLWCTHYNQINHNVHACFELNLELRASLSSSGSSSPQKNNSLQTQMGELQEQMKQLVASSTQVVENRIFFNAGANNFASTIPHYDPFIYKAQGELVKAVA